MSETKHTPGPWRICENGLIRDGGGTPIGTASTLFTDTPEQGIANRILMAAAPELFEACEAMVALRPTDGASTLGTVTMERGAFDQMVAAIAKATVKESA